MADNGAVPDEKEKLANNDPEAAFAEHELDDSKTKFINGGNSLDETKVAVRSPSEDSFTGLGKDELNKYAKDPFWVRLRWILFILFWVGWLAMLVSAIIIIVLAPRCPTRPDLKWYHNDVAYNVYAKSFLDGDESQDGYGDLAGIQKKTDYLDSLNAKTLWLSSIFKTDPNNDRAIVDHKMLDEKFGTIDALRSFCKKLMKESKRVIVDLIPNQTSKNHTWFLMSQKKEDKYANYYMWTKTPNNWKHEDGSSKWVLDPVRKEYYLSQFDGLPDLNLTNEDVIEEFKEIVNFWTGVGISGFHINDLEYLAENNTLADEEKGKSESENFADNAMVVDSLRKIIDGLDNKPGREKLLFGSVTSAGVDQMELYMGGDGKRGLHMLSTNLGPALTSGDAQEIETALVQHMNFTTKHWLGWRLTTSAPGTSRIFTETGDERLTIAHALQALLPGSSQPYYGDEIAMANGVNMKMKTVTPMQWTKEANAGFTTGTPWLAVNRDFRSKNLDSMTAQLGDNQLIESFRALNQLRGEESMQFGQTTFCSVDDLLVFARRAKGFESYMVVINLGSFTTHRFGGSKCVGGHKTATLVFHSTDKDHEQTKLTLSEAIGVDRYEVLVLKFAP